MAGEDFVEVRMSPAGVEYASGGSLMLAGARFCFEFEPGKPKLVTRAFEWECVLSKEINADGDPLFEVVEQNTEEGA